MSTTVYPHGTGRGRLVGFLRRLPAVALLPLLAASCAGLVPIEQDVALGEDAYSQLLSAEGTRTVSSGADVAMVEGVTERLVAAAIEAEPEFEVFPWQVTVLDEPQVNAFCLPGGKMAVYTGILPYTESPTGLAVVMGHEIAHATRRHGIEKVQTAQLTQTGAVIAGEYFNIDPALINSAAGVLFHLPYGRGQELEADRVGLLYMAAAGYDPREAVAFWRRMAQAGGEKPPEFLSTHPSDETRIAQIEELLPEAVQIYEQARAAGVRP